ncbi:protein FAR1-RELATED SEQUENCE 5-like [Arabidopsis lyrata subsp. lyrata]|uniref:protein FAR1-RELATED SEQUENCE 5-like n=1 Tax=Arabidopsis lyrata subsp. lyrata TaxID=81972 RepID=UPI000A29CF0D|nr:protein FAR1-RELATED SEQUENCE 5-like [Arabidopsis lyrata subsp. lyrata]|eukprot:XP_020866239.1 protein FAR1-RELATED SEQUENCE 5-like [Arabidopsis lyrata subsp. lyrata]
MESSDEEKYDSVSEDEASVSENEASVSEDEALVSEYEEEKDDIVNKENYVKTEEKKDELSIGMEFSSDETAHKAYKKFAGEHGFNNHNHDLVKTPIKHLLKGNRMFSVAQIQHADDAEMSGVSAKSTVEMMTREVGGREILGFLEKDYRNYIYRKRMEKMVKRDARAVLEYFQRKKEDNSSIFYSMQLDEDDMITNIFWADDRSISDYNLFRDVVCFDTTYKTNEYNRPFAPFIGVNHHKQTVVFGAALLYDETTESYKWLFETFLGAISGKLDVCRDDDQVLKIPNNTINKLQVHSNQS